ncbi:Zinc resistance conferring protein [Dipsacomyces acuminosporus]|nr:Zinc resistance conferring protein [Dipsacomyces acuminosporus]
MLALSSTMFFVELVVGILAGSITLVADSFHMLNDVLGMVIALWAIKAANSTKVVPNNTYGWQRAEILGALTNGVLLLGLCLTIYIDAIERFINIEEITNPKLVMIVGCVGLTFNIMGLFLFHEHGHGHGHSHGHSHGHDDEESVVGEEDSLINSALPQQSAARNPNDPAKAYDAIEAPAVALHSAGQIRSSAVEISSIIGVPHPAYTQQAIIKSAKQMQDANEVSSDEESRQSSPRPIAGDHHAAGGANKKTCKHSHKKSKKNAGPSGGHLNMHGVWLHVFGDCITNIAVIISGLVIWQAKGHWRFYFDPAMSLLINTLIVCVTIPLVKSASFILLNGVPNGVDLDEMRRDLKGIPNVLNIHDLHVWQLSDTKYVSSVHVLIDRPPVHSCIHNSNSSSETNLAAHSDSHSAPKTTRSARLVTRNNSSYKDTLRGPTAVDMDCVYMEVASEVKRVMHSYGIHSTTIQPEFVIGQSVSVATTRVHNSQTNMAAEADVGEEAGREGSIFSKVAIVPDDADLDVATGSRHATSSATIGPCLLTCRGDRCLTSSCCPGESPIKVIPGSLPKKDQASS